MASIPELPLGILNADSSSDSEVDFEDDVFRSSSTQYKVRDVSKDAFFPFQVDEDQKSSENIAPLRNRNFTFNCLVVGSISSVILGFVIMKVITVAAIAALAPYIGITLGLYLLLAAENILEEQENQAKERKIASFDDLPFANPVTRTKVEKSSEDEAASSELFRILDRRINPVDIQQVAINFTLPTNGRISTYILDLSNPHNRAIFQRLLRFFPLQMQGREFSLPTSAQNALALKEDGVQVALQYKGRWGAVHLDPALRSMIKNLLPRSINRMPSCPSGREMVLREAPERIHDCNGIIEEDFVMVPRINSKKPNPFKTYVKENCSYIAYERAFALAGLGFEIMQAIHKGRNVPHEDRPELQFSAFCWALMYHASSKEDDFIEGTFVLSDPKYRIFNYFLSRGMYGRFSSHFPRSAVPVPEMDRWAHFGFDVVSPDCPLPADKQHLVMAKIKWPDGTEKIYVKPENFGTKRLDHLVRHTIEYGQSLYRKALGKNGGGVGERKEHVRFEHDKAFQVIYAKIPPKLKPQDEAKFFHDYKEWGLQVAVALLERVQSGEISNGLRKKINKFFQMLRRRYGPSFSSRKGDEALMSSSILRMPEELEKMDVEKL